MLRNHKVAWRTFSTYIFSAFWDWKSGTQPRWFFRASGLISQTFHRPMAPSILKSGKWFALQIKQTISIWQVCWCVNAVPLVKNVFIVTKNSTTNLLFQKQRWNSYKILAEVFLNRFFLQVTPIGFIQEAIRSCSKKNSKFEIFVN